jgi:CheY-like chemotaxis protein
MLKSFRPAVVLLDIGMPQMDGYEVARRIRSQPEFTDLMLIALTGWGQEQDRRRTAEAGFNYHLTKPADIKAIETLLSFGGV